MKAVPFSPLRSTADQLDAWYRLKRDLRLEILPDEPVFSKDTLFERVQSMKALQESIRWCVWSDDGSEMIGLAGIYRPIGGSKSEPVWFYIEVAEGFRRRGIGQSLLKDVATTALKRNWKSLQIRTCDGSPAGEHFIRNAGGEKINNSFTNNLDLASTDRDLLSRWMQFPSGSPEITIGEWRDVFPEGRLQEISDFYQTVYDEGRDHQGQSGYLFSPERIRKGEKVALAGKRKRHVIYATDTATDRMIGLTETSWNESEPSVVSQGYTAVLPVARGRGIARRLKAEMLLKITDINPEARYIRAGNAGNNHTILKINSQLGFSRLLTTTVWKLGTNRLLLKLRENQ